MRQFFQSVQRRAVLRIGSLIIVVISVAALVAPVALADRWGMGMARTSGSGATLRPDDRSGVRGIGTILLGAPVAPLVTMQSEDASFQWGDAGIGAGTAFVAMMLAVGGIVFVARHRSARASTV